MEIKENKREIEKNIQNLLEEKRSLAQETGSVLFEENHSFIETEKKDAIKNFFQEKEHIGDLVKELETLQNRFQETIESQKQLDSEIKMLSKDWHESLFDFGQLLLEEYTPVFSSFLGDIYSEYETQKMLVKTITQKIDDERAEIEKMGFFSKILNQVKLSSTSANLTMQEKKLQKLYVEAGHIGIQERVFCESEDDFIKIFCEAHKKAFQMQETINEKKIALEKAQNEETLIGQNIDAIGPNGSFQKKKASLEKQKIEVENTIHNEFARLGDLFFENRIGKDPKKTLQKTDDINDGIFILLKEAFEIQKKLIINAKKIEVLDFEAEILQKEKHKKHMQQNILQNETSIERLKEQNEKLAENIVQTSEEIDEILRKKTKLEKELV